MADMVDGKRDLVSDYRANLMDILLEQVDAFLGEMQARERVLHILRIVGGIASLALLERAATAARVGVKPVERAGGCDHGARDMGDLHQAQVHLQKGESAIH